MPSPNNHLPSGLGHYIDKIKAEDQTDAELNYLQESIQAEKDASSEYRTENAALKAKTEALEASNKLLQDNNSIKKRAFTYSFFFLITVPVFCWAILLLSMNDGFSLYTTGTSFSAFWHASLNSYAQAALIISPIVFIAAIIGFLLKGVLSSNQQNPDTDLAYVNLFTKFLEQNK